MTSGGVAWQGLSSKLRTLSPQPLFASPRNVCTLPVHNSLCPYATLFFPRFVSMLSPFHVLLPLDTPFVPAPVYALSATTSLQCASENLVQSAPAPAQISTSPVLVYQPTSATSVHRNLAPVLPTSFTSVGSTYYLYSASHVPVARHDAPVSATSRTPAIVPVSSPRTTRSPNNLI